MKTGFKRNFIVGAIGGIAVGAVVCAALTGTFNATEKSVSVLAEIASDADMVGYNYSIIDCDAGISYAGMTTVLKDAVALNVYFDFSDGKTIDEYDDFTVDGMPVEPKMTENGMPVEPKMTENGMYYVTVSDISAKELGNSHVITVGGLTISNISAMTYVYRVAISESPTEETVALVQALYEYYKAAENYFCDGHEYESERISETTGYRVGVRKHTCKNCGGKYFDTVDYTEGLKFSSNAAGTGYVVSAYEGDNFQAVIPNRYNGLPVLSIDEGAFAGGNAQSVLIPLNVVKIEAGAFTACNVYYAGSAADWESVSVDENSGLTAVYYYSEIQPESAGNYWHYENGEIVAWPAVVTKITVEMTVKSYDEEIYSFTPAVSGRYQVSFSNEAVILSIGEDYSSVAEFVYLESGTSYTFFLGNRSYSDISGTLTIEFIE